MVGTDATTSNCTFSRKRACAGQGIVCLATVSVPGSRSELTPEVINMGTHACKRHISTSYLILYRCCTKASSKHGREVS